mmetsp:Transcript_10647/g.17360  ORF Transcript_10647/g.17360 Transcript_10647/m.17360 type:complete len:202 (+) Transcript_10647:1341-1946(+)
MGRLCTAPAFAFPAAVELDFNPPSTFTTIEAGASSGGTGFAVAAAPSLRLTILGYWETVPMRGDKKLYSVLSASGSWLTTSVAVVPPLLSPATVLAVAEAVALAALSDLPATTALLLVPLWSLLLVVVVAPLAVAAARFELLLDVTTACFTNGNKGGATASGRSGRFFLSFFLRIMLPNPLPKDKQDSPFCRAFDSFRKYF